MYEIHYTVNGQRRWIVVTAESAHKATRRLREDSDRLLDVLAVFPIKDDN